MRHQVHAPAAAGAAFFQHVGTWAVPRIGALRLQSLMLRYLLPALLLLPGFAPTAQAQAQGAGSLAVSGEGITARSFSAAELAALPRVSAPEKKRDGTSFTYEGVPLFELLKAANPAMEKEVHGDKLTWVVLVQAADGYRVVFTLAELDPTVNDRVVFLADRRDGQPLPAAEGPLRVLAAGDKRPTRSARQVVSITLKRVQ